MRASAVRIVLALVLAAPLCPAAAQNDPSFVLLTQNVLRFGHGRRLQAQCNAITTASQTVDIIVLQEVMTPEYPCLRDKNNKGVDLPLPPDFQYVTSGARGRSSYMEYYGILFRTADRNNMRITKDSVADNPGAAFNFMRPPYGVRFRVSNVISGHSCKVWIVDFHAIFGKTIRGRRDEAAAMQNAYATLRATGSAVIMAGDWNLPADDHEGFGWVAANSARIDPDVPTSLTANGVPSSAYDHLIYTSNAIPPSVTITQAVVYTGGLAEPVWRTAVSDHMGVMADVTLQC